MPLMLRTTEARLAELLREAYEDGYEDGAQDHIRKEEALPADDADCKPL